MSAHRSRSSCAACTPYRSRPMPGSSVRRTGSSIIATLSCVFRWTPASEANARVEGRHRLSASAGRAAPRRARSLAPRPRVLCHSDLHAANLVATERGLVLLDWEYAHVSEALWDLAGWACNNDLEPVGSSLPAGELSRASGLRRRGAAPRCISPGSTTMCACSGARCTAARPRLADGRILERAPRPRRAPIALAPVVAPPNFRHTSGLRESPLRAFLERRR